MTQTILLADDSPTIQRLVAQTFEGAAFSVVSVSNGEAAVRKVEEIRPDLVLADVYMPGKNGYEVCAFIKGHAALRGTPVVLLVGAFEAFDEQEAERVGADGQVKKPFEPQQLFEVVSGMIGGRRDADTNAEDEPEIEGDDDGDLLGLAELFPSADPNHAVRELSESDIELIADRVIQRLSTDLIEGIAWEVVPGIADKVIHDELKKQNEN